MEKRVLFTELDDRGSHLRKEITPTAVVTDKRRFPTAQFWDANKTYDVIVADATSASDTLEKAEKNLNNEIARAQRAENALSDKIDDLLGIDAEDIEDLKQLVEDLDPETGILSVIEQNKDDINNLADDVDKLIDDISVTVDNTNGYDYVDLGLPSGTLWATMNVGASSESDNGLYFSWGNTEGHAKGSGYNFSESAYSSTSGSSISTNIAADSGYDAARVNMGGDWRMPTKEEFEELHSNCTWTWETISGVNGYRITSNTNSNSIFLPAVGSYDGTTNPLEGFYGYYWSSSLYNSTRVYSTYFGSTYIYSPGYSGRNVGKSIRAVYTRPDKVLGTTILDSERAAWNAKSDFSGSYTDLTDKPTLATVATTGSYNDLLDKPDLSLKANVEDISTTKLVYENNNHEYVDLGLPSGTCWSTTNLGASSETGYGDLYKWGALSPYGGLSTEGSDSTYVLPKTRDAANFNFGGEWRMPTKEQFEELIANTSQSFESNYKNSGINGILFVASNGNSIFFPNAGYEDSGVLNGRTFYGFYWSSTASTATEAYFIWNSEIDKWNPVMSKVQGIYSRTFKMPIRPVLKLTEQQILGKTVTDAEKAVWNAKANASDYYTKAEIDAMLQLITNA